MFVWQQPFASPVSAPGPIRVPAAPLIPKLGPLHIRAGAATIEVPASIRRQWVKTAPQVAVSRARRWLAGHAEQFDSGRVSVRLAWSIPAVQRLIAASRTTTRSVSSPARVASVELRLPAIQQVYRNDCEAAALSIFLRGKIDQRRLQQELPIAEPFSRQTVAGRVVWGDPEVGFVGDVRGGGYGVYDRPLLKLARRYDHGATDLTGRPFSAVVASIIHARPVIAWIALGPSRPATWQTPRGSTIAANFAEHTIVLTGIQGQTVTYIDPWDGTRKAINLAQLRGLWRELGTRAIAGSPLGQPSIGR
jgi:uncharacterized protein YvpB